MARPEKISEVTERHERFALFYTENFATEPAVLKHYTAMLEAVQKFGGKVERQYTTVEMYIPKTQKQLQAQLETDQRTWDRHRDLYLRAVKADPEEEPVKEYERSYVQEWARKEHKPDPFDVFAANDPDLRDIRKSLGMNDD
jgi:hypothetical protein